MEWWRSQGVVAIVSALRTRHALADYLEQGFLVRWHPLIDVEQARDEVAGLVETVRELLATPGVTAVLVHCDSAGEWLSAIDASLRLGLGLAKTPRAALRAAKADGLPVGSVTTSIVGRAQLGGGVTGVPTPGPAAAGGGRRTPNHSRGPPA